MLATRIARRLRRTLREAYGLGRQGNPLQAVAYFGLSMANLKIPIDISVHGRTAAIRSSTPDCRVLLECLAGEFEQAIKAAAPNETRSDYRCWRLHRNRSHESGKAFPEARVVTLEPSRGNFEILRRNTAAYPNITALNKALGRSEGTSSLVNRTPAIEIFHLQNPKDCASPAMLHEVEITTVPAILSELGKDGIDILKLDIEGGGFDLLTDDPAWLQSTRIVSPSCTTGSFPAAKNYFDA